MAIYPNLQTKVADLKGMTPRLVGLFSKLAIETLADLLSYQPRRWDDFSQITPIAQLTPGQVAIKAQLLEAKGRYLGYRGLHLTEALIMDESGLLRVIWFNQPYRSKSLKLQSWYYFAGLYDLKYKHLQLINPSTELIDGDKPKSNLIKPIYSTTAGLKSSYIQRLIARHKILLEDFDEPLPFWLKDGAKLMPLAEVYRQMHFPAQIKETEQALIQLNLRQLIALSLSSQILKLARRQEKATNLSFKKALIKKVVQSLDFQLTGQQQQITEAVLQEMASSKITLNRLIQGDVGAGKTLIAALIALNVINNGYQVAFLAPTQILAQQHFMSVQEIYKSYLKASEIELFTAALKTSVRRERLENIASGKSKLIIGTHALLSGALKFENLALVIIDEQHRFGVTQRLKLLEKAKPHLANILTLSATPIPRSLALVIYADLDISLLTEKPPQRLPVKTEIIPLKQRSNLRQILATRSPENQIYIVCPAIDDLEMEDSLAKIEAYFKSLVPGLEYAVLHAKLKHEIKEKIMVDFIKGHYEVLLSTSIIGAGLDIISANTIIIMSPERFGLAQLHQFRGRVGRGASQGHCYLCPFSDQAPSMRLQAFMDCDDGFKLSEMDLKFRGPGVIYGIEQSGVVPVFRNNFFNLEAVKLATRLAAEFIERNEDLADYPGLNRDIIRYQQITHLN